MKPAPMKGHPAFDLIKLNDVQKSDFFQMPRWLFTDPRYAEMDLEAKVAYMLLLNRLQLSRVNGWVNEGGEVFVIFTRKTMAEELRISEKRATAAFHTLTERGLVWETRCGRGHPNRIYLAKVSAGRGTAKGSPGRAEPQKQTVQEQQEPQKQTVQERQEPQERPLQNRPSDGCRTAVPTVAEPQNRLPNYTDTSQKERNQNNYSQSVTAPHPMDGGGGDGGEGDDGLTDEREELSFILYRCQLASFSPSTASLFETAVERLFYAPSVKVGHTILSRDVVRARLKELDVGILRTAERKLSEYGGKEIRNPMGYAMSTLMNCVAEREAAPSRYARRAYRR